MAIDFDARERDDLMAGIARDCAVLDEDVLRRLACFVASIAQRYAAAPLPETTNIGNADTWPPTVVEAEAVIVPSLGDDQTEGDA